MNAVAAGSVEFEFTMPNALILTVATAAFRYPLMGLGSGAGFKLHQPGAAETGQGGFVAEFERNRLRAVHKTVGGHATVSCRFAK